MTMIPNPLSSDWQYARFYHLDLSSLEDVELTDELHYLRPLLWGLDKNHWLRQRAKAIEAEIIRRRGSKGHEFRGQPKPKLAEGVKL